MKGLEREVMNCGRLLFERRLVSGWGGNISVRLPKGRFLITGQHAPLGFLGLKDLVRINEKGQPLKKGHQSSSETPLHLAVYRGTDAKAVIHAHPPMVMVFSLTHGSFVPLSYEEKYTIGEVPVIPQETPTVTEPEKVIEELRLHPIVILQGHGTVAVGKDLREAFLFTDLLEEAVHCQFFKSEAKANPEPTPEKQKRPERDGQRPKGYPLFSPEHMSALMESVNNDPQFQSQGHETGLTTTMTFHLEGVDTPWTVHFEKGRITRLEAGGEGEFVISGKKEWWEAIFQSRLDPFLAAQQGKLKLKRGELWKLSRWFKPFQRAFRIWQTIPLK